MTPAQKAKAAGNRSLNDVAEFIGKPPATLRNWAKDSPMLFEVVIYGAAKLNRKV